MHIRIFATDNFEAGPDINYERTVKRAGAAHPCMRVSAVKTDAAARTHPEDAKTPPVEAPLRSVRIVRRIVCVPHVK